MVNSNGIRTPAPKRFSLGSSTRSWSNSPGANNMTQLTEGVSSSSSQRGNGRKRFNSEDRISSPADPLSSIPKLAPSVTDASLDAAYGLQGRQLNPESDDAYESDEDDLISSSSSPRRVGGSSPPKEVESFDLCAVLYKRRFGLARNAADNWKKRVFTLHGPILCYYDKDDPQNIDPSRPRRRLNLKHDETIAELHTRHSTAPTEFLLTVNIYLNVGGKRKWEICCRDRTQQVQWYDALRAFDGSKEREEGHGAIMDGRNPFSPMTSPGSDAGGRGKRLIGKKTNVQRVRSYDSSNHSNENVDGKRDKVTEEITKEELQQPPLQQQRSSDHVLAQTSDVTKKASFGELFSDPHVAVAFLVINISLYFAHREGEDNFRLSFLLANVVIFFLVDHVANKSYGRTSKRSVDKKLHMPIPSANTTAVRVSERSADTRDSSDDPAAKSGCALRKAGSTIARGTIRENSALSNTLKDGGGAPDTLEGTRACAAVAIAATGNGEDQQLDYDVNPHSYWNANHSLFNLRAGPNYKKTKKKEPSGPALYDLYKMDLVQDSTVLKNVADAFEIPTVPGITDIQAPVKEVPAMLIFNVGLPIDEPSVFGGVSDGPTCTVILYFVITKNTLKELADLDRASPAVKLFAEWCKRGESDEVFRSRLKALAVVEELDKLGFPSFINGYNGKPALITKSGKYVRHETYGEMAVNVWKWGYLAKKGLYTLRDEFPRFRVNIGFVVEGRKDDELPEVLVGGVRAMHINLAKVPPVYASGLDESSNHAM